MARFTATLAVVLLGFINLSTENKATCDLYAAVGQNLVLPFTYEKLSTSHVLRWTHNHTIIFYRQQGRVSVGKPDDISPAGALNLRNVQFSSTGAYQANVLHNNNTLAKTWAGNICVIEKVSKPAVRYVCDFKSSAVNLDCAVANPQGLSFSWTLDKKTLSSETKQTLRISLNQLKGQRSFTCTVANRASQETSDTIHPICKSPPPPPPLCFASTTVKAVLGGGAAVILLLIVIIITMCCCNRRRRSQMRLEDKSELRMLSRNRRDPDSFSPEYETMHPTEKCPPPSPQSSPRACYRNVSRPQVEPENRHSQLSTAAEGQRPSPVPKPRTKNPQTANN